jgi:hypothetical protein
MVFYYTNVRNLKITIMIRSKLPSGGLLLAGLAALAYYKYTTMSEDEKRNLVSGLKEKGQKLYDEYIPQNIKDLIEKKGDNNAQSHFGEGSGYTG